MTAVESDSAKSARKAKDKLHKACEGASEICEQTLHRYEQNNAHGKHESQDSSGRSNAVEEIRFLEGFVNLI